MVAELARLWILRDLPHAGSVKRQKQGLILSTHDGVRLSLYTFGDRHLCLGDGWRAWHPGSLADLLGIVKKV